MPNHTRSILDSRKPRRLEDRRLVLVITLFLVVVSGTAIGLVYGWGVMGSGVACLIGGLTSSEREMNRAGFNLAGLFRNPAIISMIVLVYAVISKLFARRRAATVKTTASG
jgi:hypothetical protein